MRISDWSSDVCSSDLVAGFLCVAQEARVDPGVAEAERFAVYAHRPVLKRADQFFSRVHQRIEIAAMFPPLAVCGSDEYLERRIAGPRAHAGRSEEHTSELQSLMRISYAVFCLKKKNNETLRKS